MEAKKEGTAVGAVKGVPDMDAVKVKGGSPAAGTVETMDTDDAGPVTYVSGLCGQSVMQDGAKSASVKISLFKGQTPVHLKPAFIFDGVAAIGKESLTIAGMSFGMSSCQRRCNSS